jgi:cell division protein FtsB
MNQYEMIAFIVLAVMIASIVKSAIRAKHGLARDNQGNEVSVGNSAGTDPDSDRLRDEVKVLKDRIAVLERLATDNNRAIELDREIDKLR